MSYIAKNSFKCLRSSNNRQKTAHQLAKSISHALRFTMRLL